MVVLDEQQHVVVEAPLTPLLVVAGAGTGKTRTLTHRVVHWIGQGLDSERSLLVTFTQRAAREMGERIHSLQPNENLPWIGTFHRIAARLLRDYASQIGYQADFKIMDYGRCQRFMNSVLEQAPNCPPNLTANTLIKAYSLSVNADKSLTDPMVHKHLLPNLDIELIESLYIDYLVMKIENNCMDFDDLLLYFNQLLEQDSLLRDEICSRFDAIFVDEYQDVNPLQVSIIDSLCYQHQRLTVVGDDKQSIYGFRGSDVGAILNFENRYPMATVLSLNNNYRSTPQILGFANRSMRHNHRQRHLELSPVRADGPMPVIKDFASSAEQARFICEEIERLHKAGVPFHEQAVLYRTHAQAREIELALGERGVPYNLRSGRRLFERPHIRPLFDLLSILTSDSIPMESASVLELFHGVGPVAAREIIAQMTRRGSLTSWLQNEPQFAEMNSRFTEPIRRVHSTLKTLSQTLNGPLWNSLSKMIENVIEPWVRRTFDDSDERFMDLTDCIRLSMEFEHHTDFIEALTLSSNMDATDAGVVLSTVHRAKGLEWASVFIVGLAEGSFPLLGSERGIKMAEERRLFYVAMTRCQRWLYLCHAWQEHAAGSILAPSRFLREVVPPQHYSESKPNEDEVT